MLCLRRSADRCECVDGYSRLAAVRLGQRRNQRSVRLQLQFMAGRRGWKPHRPNPPSVSHRRRYHMGGGVEPFRRIPLCRVLSQDVRRVWARGSERDLSHSDGSLHRCRRRPSRAVCPRRQLDGVRPANRLIRQELSGHRRDRCCQHLCGQTRGRSDVADLPPSGLEQRDEVLVRRYGCVSRRLNPVRHLAEEPRRPEL